MLRSAGLLRIAALTSLLSLTACPIQLVAPYNSDLQQHASTLQAEVATWDLSMRKAAGTVRADPRYPDLAATLDKWRGEADAMLTQAVANDAGIVHCGKAVDAVRGLIQGALPADLRAATDAGKPAPTGGCMVQLVAEIPKGIDAIESSVAFCKVERVKDDYFAAVATNSATAPKPGAAPNQAAQTALTRQCQSEFRPSSSPVPNAADAGHGRAVSHLLRTLQAIVYVENRKKPAETAK